MPGPDDEQSLVRRPNNLPEHVTSGGFIVGAEQNIQGSLMALSGIAVERISRERAEVPPDQRLPENAVYFMDQDAKRVVMVSRRDSRPDWKSGLFAETVELDQEGKPLFRLSTKEVILTRNQYQMVAVRPNPYGMPPSHIDMMEEEVPGQEKFVPWNLYVATLQSWMNELSIDPNEDFESFMKKFDELRDKSKKDVKAKVKSAFLGGPQGFDQTVAPFNLIITDEVHKDMYRRASEDAGLFPVFISPKEFILKSQDLPEMNQNLDEIRRRIGIYGDWKYSIAHFLPTDWGSKAKEYSPAVITQDWTAIWRLEKQDEKFTKKVVSPAALHSIVMSGILNNNPIFTYVDLMVDETGNPSKEGNGSYHCPNSEQTYREFLYKIKSDLLLTMFLRGGASMVK